MDEDRFRAYMSKVRKELARMTQGAITHEDDLPDFCYRDAFDDAIPPATVARRVLADAAGC